MSTSTHLPVGKIPAYLFALTLAAGRAAFAFAVFPLVIIRGILEFKYNFNGIANSETPYSSSLPTEASFCSKRSYKPFHLMPSNVGLMTIVMEGKMRYNIWKLLFLLLLIGGCHAGSRPSLVPLSNTMTTAKVSKASAFDESQGYLHKASGVGFKYPANWQRDDAQGEETDTNLGLNRPGEAKMTLFWTEIPNPPQNISDQFGQIQYCQLREIYKEKVSQPTSITIAGQPGYEFAINCGPMGDNSEYTVGADFIFLVRRVDRTWIIEMRASARDAATLKALKPLLANYRIMPDPKGTER